MDMALPAGFPDHWLNRAGNKLALRIPLPVRNLQASPLSGPIASQTASPPIPTPNLLPSVGPVSFLAASTPIPRPANFNSPTEFFPRAASNKKNAGEVINLSGKTGYCFKPGAPLRAA